MRLSKKLSILSAFETALGAVLTTDASDPVKICAMICMAAGIVAYIVTEGFAVDRIKCHNTPNTEAIIAGVVAKLSEKKT